MRATSSIDRILPTPGAWRTPRRRVLRGLGGAAIALPFLDVMAPRRARAQAAIKRYVTYFKPGGTVIEDFRPTGTGTTFSFTGSITAPLEPWKQKILSLEGIDLKITSIGNGHPHSKGMGGLLTGRELPPGPYDTCGGTAGFAGGPSIDQVIAARLAATPGGATRFKSLEVGVRWLSYGTTIHPWNAIVFAGANQPLPIVTNPQDVFTRVFSDLATDQARLATERLRQRSILDGVAREFQALAARVGREDRAKLDAHLTKVREIEATIETTSAPGTVAACSRPELGTAFDASSDANMPRTGKAMQDLLVMAFACDLTRVATLQWVDSPGRNTFPWLGLNQNHHAYQHDQGYQPENIKKIDLWYMQQFAAFLQALAAVQESGQSLLDSACVLLGSEISHPSSHGQSNMPFLLAGGAGGALRPGRALKFGGVSHNNLLVSILNAFDVPDQRFGNPSFCTGPLAGLT